VGLFQKHCSVCNSRQSVKHCPYCKNDVCDSCLKYLVLKKETPVWFIGKSVKNYQEYTQLFKEYLEIFRKRGVIIHCCEEYLKSAWAEIIKQVKEYEKQYQRKATKIILK